MCICTRIEYVCICISERVCVCVCVCGCARARVGAGPVTTGKEGVPCFRWNGCHRKPSWRASSPPRPTRGESAHLTFSLLVSRSQMTFAPLVSHSLLSFSLLAFAILPFHCETCSRLPFSLWDLFTTYLFTVGLVHYLPFHYGTCSLLTFSLWDSWTSLLFTTGLFHTKFSIKCLVL